MVGEGPPLHHDVVVLGRGTTSHAGTDGSRESGTRPTDSSSARWPRSAPAAVPPRQYLRAGLVDEVHLADVPVLLVRGQRLFEDLGSGRARAEFTPSGAVVHVRLRRGRVFFDTMGP